MVYVNKLTCLFGVYGLDQVRQAPIWVHRTDCRKKKKKCLSWEWQNKDLSTLETPITLPKHGKDSNRPSKITVLM